jgi:hypothetical protein
MAGAEKREDNAEARRTPRFAEKTREEERGGLVGSGRDGPSAKSAKGEASISRLTVAWTALSGKIISIERSDSAVELRCGGLNGAAL